MFFYFVFIIFFNYYLSFWSQFLVAPTYQKTQYFNNQISEFRKWVEPRAFQHPRHTYHYKDKTHYDISCCYKLINLLLNKRVLALMDEGRDFLWRRFLYKNAGSLKINVQLWFSYKVSFINRKTRGDEHKSKFIQDSKKASD